MTDSFTLTSGNVPLLISMPHNGHAIPDDIAATMTDDGRSSRDTDWFKDKLYDFAQALGAYTISPTYSRFVIDLNRDTAGTNLYPGANSTELCPTTAFDLAPLYQDGKQPNAEEVDRRIALYWQPYHQALAATLTEMKAKFGVAVLLEAHSIQSHVPRFFEGRLPDFNFGTADGASCSPAMLQAVENLDLMPYSRTTNGRFKGGFITREYGDPENNIHALQLELSQITYMDEQALTYNEELAKKVKPKLKAMVEALISFAQQAKT
ncbi:N-formylglutamate deformylase [Thalassotalea euphylliae]|uniref:N-formylglutamate deformylase n=1 Tax=Thalassotalea euphylliae TaxID=1655234 RepID=UPI00362F2991